MSILYSLLGLIVLSLFSVIVLPIAVVSFFVGVAGLVASIGKWKTRESLNRDSVAFAWQKRVKGFLLKPCRDDVGVQKVNAFRAYYVMLQNRYM